MTDNTQTTLSAFDIGDDVDAGDRSEADGSPTPAENARDIEYLIQCVEGLSEDIEAVVDEIEQQEAGDSISTESTSTERMFY